MHTNKATTITTGNFKGGVGKTTNAVMIGFTLAKRGHKVLICDLDPQANATETLFNTIEKVYFRKVDFKKTLFTAIKEENLLDAVVKVNDNLDILPSYEDLQGYERYLYSKFEYDTEMDFYFNQLLEPLKQQYDYIICDVPPQLNKFTDSALVASDFVVIIMQTQERALRGSEKYIEHLLTLNDVYGTHIELAGVLPVLLQNGNATDIDVLLDAKAIYGEENLFKTTIKQMARLKRYDRTGITQFIDAHDKKIHYTYDMLTIELLERLEKFKPMDNADNKEETVNEQQ